jgi:hypothetical protein
MSVVFLGASKFVTRLFDKDLQMILILTGSAPRKPRLHLPCREDPPCGRGASHDMRKRKKWLRYACQEIYKYSTVFKMG